MQCVVSMRCLLAANGFHWSSSRASGWHLRCVQRGEKLGTTITMGCKQWSLKVDQWEQISFRKHFPVRQSIFALFFESTFRHWLSCLPFWCPCVVVCLSHWPWVLRTIRLVFSTTPPGIQVLLKLSRWSLVNNAHSLRRCDARGSLMGILLCAGWTCLMCTGKSLATWMVSVSITWWRWVIETQPFPLSCQILTCVKSRWLAFCWQNIKLQLNLFALIWCALISVLAMSQCHLLNDAMCSREKEVETFDLCSISDGP